MSTISFELNGKSMTAHIKENVPFAALLQAITDGVSICYDDDGAYRAELLDFAIEYMCLSTLTDIDIGENAEDAWPYIRGIDGVPSVDADFIADGIRASVKHKNSLVRASMQTYGVSTLVERLDAIASSVETMVASASALMNDLIEAAEKSKDIDLSSLAEAISGTKLDEQKVVNAILDFQKANTKQEKKPAAKKRTPRKAVAVRES